MRWTWSASCWTCAEEELACASPSQWTPPTPSWGWRSPPPRPRSRPARWPCAASGASADRAARD
eukprot:scaffold526_cov230-Pinguiococcus_pyrenoidosus.AAC.11